MSIRISSALVETMKNITLATLIISLVMAFGSARTCRAELITTLFAANNGQSGNMFNINVLAPDGITIEALDLNLANGNWDINVYTLDGSYIGNETNSAAWTLHDSITGLTSSGVDLSTNWDVANLGLSSGIQAFYLEVTNGSGIRYTNGTTEGAVFADDGNIQIFEGTGNIVGFGTQFRPRVWNGTIHYAVPEPQTVITMLGICLGGILFRRPRRLS